MAIKLLTAAAGAASQERLLREGISACLVEHPNAVEVLDLCITDTGIPFLVMELLQGHSLDEELKREGTLSLQRSAEILNPTCEVLSEAHNQGIIHRDVKPQNVFLHRSRHGEVVKMLDFGIAQMVGESMLSSRLTVEGSLVGTPVYMAPERLADTPYDGRADVYNLGIRLYEMLVGRRPFSSPDLLELIRMHVNMPPRPLHEIIPELPRAAEAVVLRALAKDPQSRPTAAEMASDFEATLPPDGRVVVLGRGPVGLRGAAEDADGDRTATEQWSPFPETPDE